AETGEVFNEPAQIAVEVSDCVAANTHDQDQQKTRPHYPKAPPERFAAKQCGIHRRRRTLSLMLGRIAAQHLRHLKKVHAARPAEFLFDRRAGSAIGAVHRFLFASRINLSIVDSRPVKIPRPSLYYITLQAGSAPVPLPANRCRYKIVSLQHSTG